MEFSRSRILASLVLAGLVLGLVALACRSAVYEDLNLWTYDFLVNHDGYMPSSRDVVFVDFDDATFESIGQYPLPRRQIAEVLEKVAARHPAVIGLDIFLSEPRSKQEDAEMQSVLTQAGNVVLASQSGVGGIPATLPLSQFCQPEAPAALSGFCKEGTPGGLAFAPVNLPVDNDGFVRRAFLFVGGAHPAVSFPLMLAQQFAGEAVQPDDANAARFHNQRIAYSNPIDKTVLIGTWNKEPVLKVSALSLLRDPSAQPDLAGKVVIVGQSSDAARDRHLTPVFRSTVGNQLRPRISGPEIHAAAIATLLSGRSIAPARSATLWAVSATAVLAFLSVVLAAPLWVTTTGLLLLVAGLYGAAQLLFNVGHIWFPFLLPIMGVTFAVPLGLGYRFFEERVLRSRAAEEREQIMTMFSRYVSPDVAQQIWRRRREIVLAGEERVATVVFTDIRSFTAITAGKPSDVVLGWLNDYLTAMDEVITAHRGFLNKFIGDGLMILFGVPLSGGESEDAVNAMNCAQAMLERVAESNRTHADDPQFPQLKIGVGIHTGRLTCGNIGSTQRMEYSVIGETVNLASRLESLTKELHSDIVLSSATYVLVKDSCQGIRPLGSVAVRGFEEKIELYGLSRGAQEPTIARVTATESN